MLGLDAAGKTTILYKLHIGEVLSTVPTIGKPLSLCLFLNNSLSSCNSSSSHHQLVKLVGLIPWFWNKFLDTSVVEDVRFILL